MTTANAHENTEGARMTEGPSGGVTARDTADSTPRGGPYAHSARLWRAAGWLGVLPVVGKDQRLPGGFTGHAGVWPSGDQVADWISRRGNDNIVIRLPRNVIGIDVDAYDGRVGLETINNFEMSYGELPATYVSTSRDDGSGIRLYHVPENVQWVSDLGSKSDVQIIRHDHRYFVAWPSIHPITNRTYQINMPVGLRSEHPPRPEQLTNLPDAWVTVLTKRDTVNIGGTSNLVRPGDPAAHDLSSVDPSLMLFVGAPPGEQDQRLFEYVCSMRARKFRMEEAIFFAITAVSKMEHSRPDEPWTPELARNKVVRIWQTIREGTTAEQSLTTQQRAWAQSVSDSLSVLSENTPATPVTTVSSVNGVQNASPESGAQSPITNIPTPRVVNPPPADDHPSENLTDTGNALRFARLFAGKSLRYIPEYRQWHIWNGARWKIDTRSTALDLTRVVSGDIRDDGIRMAQTAPEDARERIIREYGTWAQSSESERARKAMLSLACTLPSFIVHAEELDADPRLLGCDNGVIELLDDGWRFREGTPEDKISLSTGVMFDADAHSEMWDQFISYIQPDIAVRTHLQALDGYTLQGVNNERCLIILKGDTTTGKSTYLEVVSTVLGEYSSVANASIFVGNSQERARADLVRILPKRRIHMSEIEATTQLHAEQVKRMTGGDQISARLPYSKEYVTRLPSFTPIAAMNGLPTIHDADVALKRRIRPVPFSVRLDANPAMMPIVSSLRDDTPKAAILNWLLDGWSLYRKGTLDIPVAANTELALDINDQLSGASGFIDTYCEVDVSYSDTSERLFIAYQLWEMNERVRDKNKPTLTAFGLMLERAGFPKSRARTMVNCSDGIQRKKTLRHGIRLRPEWEATVQMHASVRGIHI